MPQNSESSALAEKMPIGSRSPPVAQGLCLHARMAMSGWLGEHLDVAYAIDVLHPSTTS